jgi:thiol:disulfide interchange protein DsbD
VQYAPPHRKNESTGILYELEGTTLNLVEVTPPASFTPGSPVKLSAKVNYQICNEQGCMPPKSVSAETEIATAAEGKDGPGKAEIAKARATLPAVPADWKLTSEIKADQLLITITGGANATEDPGMIWFYDEAAWAKTAAPLVTREGSTWTIKVPKSDTPKAEKPFGRLVASQGWLKDGSVGALLVNLEATSPVAITEEKTSQGFQNFGTVSAKSYWQALLLAFLGGLLLNLMPCVFPVLGLKVLGFAKLGGQDSKKIFLHGAAFSLGLLVFVWILAFILIQFSKTWGFQMRNPTFLAIMVCVLFIMGLWLFGVAEFGAKLTQLGGGSRGSGYVGSFFSGVLTTLVATPCTGPFLGTTLGYAASLAEQPGGKTQAMLIFTVFGLGIAAPYLVLSAMPRLIKLLPKPGDWMETFKKILSFPLLAFVVYFLNAFGELTGQSSMSWLLLALVVLGAAMWVYGHWCPPYSSGKGKNIGLAATLALTALGGYLAYGAVRDRKTETVQKAKVTAETIDQLGEDEWADWDPDLLEQLRKRNRIVYLDYTTPG